MSKWISILDRLPEKEVRVLVYVESKDFIDIDSYVEIYECPVSFSTQSICIGEGWESGLDGEITHWMPLPTPPKEEA